MTRYVIIGAGAVGVTFAAELHRAGSQVLLVARGEQLAALQAGTLRYVRPDGITTLDLPFAGGPGDVELADGDVLVLTTKSQDTEQTVAEWAWRPARRADGTWGPAATTVPIVTLQNGLDSERIALRRFTNVLGLVVWVPASYVTAGEVVSPATPTVGAIWLGRYPSGDHPLLSTIADDLRAASFAVQVVPDIVAWKATKLLSSVGFALDALYRPSSLRDDAAKALTAEARAVLTAAGVPIADQATQSTLDLSGFVVESIPGHPRGGSSSWQSLARTGSLEADFLNGEIVLQARLSGGNAPLNSALLERIRRAADEGVQAGSLGDDDLLTVLPGLRRAPVLVSAAELQASLSDANPPVLLDVRWALGDPHGHDHYRDGHIPSAVYVDLDSELAAPATPLAGRHPLPDIADLQAAARRWGVRAGRPVVAYDNSGGLAAARAWWLLRWAGVEDVRLLDGSLAAWRAQGYPLATGDQYAAAGDITLSPGHLPTLTADEAAELAGTGVLLDARASERYRGEVEPIDPRAGHIPGARSAPTGENLDEHGTFAAPEKLRARFAELGADLTERVGVYCGSGVTAAHQIAALAVAGIDAALYPGSWSAWSSDARRPVATGSEPYEEDR